MSITTFFRRVFRRTAPAPSVDYVSESELPADSDELERLGVIRQWRVEAASDEQWFVADIGAIQWYVDNLGGHRR